MKKVISAIRDLYPEAIGIYLVGSVARGEPKPDSDIDILILCQEDTDGWRLVCRDHPLWRDFPTINGRKADYIVQPKNGPTVGQYRHRERLGLPNPMVSVWEVGHAH